MKPLKSFLLMTGLAVGLLAAPALTTHADTSGVSATSTSTNAGTPGGNEPNHVTVHTGKKVASGTLPQTGESTVPLLSGVGVASVLLVLTTVSLRKKRR